MADSQNMVKTASVQSAPNFYNINVTQEHSVSQNTLGEMTHDINTLRNDMLKQDDLEDFKQSLKADILQTVERRMS